MKPTVVVYVRAGASIRLRAATPAERQELELADGEPVAVVTHNGRDRIYPAGSTTFIAR